ncbi:hypothetical protein CANCADRAFT_4324 [Tortispora caseinolytica NRRL Y-17796]|uniref:Uncharacterized protein n=1 Tax=Tortispora caseinolytica NRRL Y-17796 TaxID=767744 RepID=A0A1E4TD61_9ASCO|nr:hypothetical protein CANCADRAFT_4324 [Tortispora caseinolytica NRRL Y-17796]
MDNASETIKEAMKMMDSANLAAGHLEDMLSNLDTKLNAFLESKDLKDLEGLANIGKSFNTKAAELNGLSQELESDLNAEAKDVNEALEAARRDIQQAQIDVKEALKEASTEIEEAQREIETISKPTDNKQ